MPRNPMYLTMYNDLKKKIKDGDYEIGAFLPTEKELEEIYGVSRTTVRNAINELVKDKYIESTRGRGTKVLDYRYTQSLRHVTSISQTLRQKGYRIDTKKIMIDKVNISDSKAKILGIPVNTECYRIQRVQYADAVPITIMENYIKADKVPQLENHIQIDAILETESDADEYFSLYDTFEKVYGIHIDSADNTIEAVNADFTEAMLLDVSPGAALLRIRRTAKSANMPVSYDVVTARGDRFQFEITSEGRRYIEG